MWRINSPQSFQEIGAETNGIQEGQRDPLLKDYLFQAFTPDFATLLFEQPTKCWTCVFIAEIHRQAFAALDHDLPAGDGGVNVPLRAKAAGQLTAEERRERRQ